MKEVKNKDTKIVTVSYHTIGNLEKQERNRVFEHKKTITDKPVYREIVNGATSIMKFGGSFDGARFLEIANRVKLKGKHVFPHIKDAHGGGQGAQAWGVIHITETDKYEDLLKRLDITEEMHKLPIEKQLTRIQKFLSRMDSLKVKPKIKLIPDGLLHEGLIAAEPEWMVKNNLVFAEKTTGPMKGLLIHKQHFIDSAETEIKRKMLEELLTGADLYAPNNENKIKLPVEKLERLLHVERTLVPEKAISTKLKHPITGELGRNPVLSHDLQALMRTTPKPRLDDIKALYEKGEWTEELIEHMFGYWDEKTQKTKLRMEGEMIKSGVSPHDPAVKAKTMRAAWTLTSHRLQPSTPGVYGVAIPLEIVPNDVQRQWGWINRWPWMMPMWAEYAVYQDCIAVGDKIMKLFGGDFDRDLMVAYKFTHTGINFTKMYDRLSDWMKTPEKKDVEKQTKTREEVIAFILDQYSGCGQIFNSGKVVVDTARYEGWSYWKCLELEARITATWVQPFINGFKNAGFEGKLPTVFELATEYKVPTHNLMRIGQFFSVVRTGIAGLDNIIKIGNELGVKADSLSYYERVVSIFKDWKTLEAHEEDGM
jgi:hypothetical protein